MPFRDTTTFKGLPEFYNLTMAVGPNQPNRATDVMLVKFLLNKYYQHNGQAPRPSPLDARRGTFDLTTRSRILAFQWEMIRRQGFRVYADNIVDRAKTKGLSSIQQSFYTIHLLNLFFKDAVEEGLEPPGTFDKIEDHPELPPEVAEELRQQKGRSMAG